MIDDKFTARLCDFGLDRVIRQDGGKTLSTTATAHHGTIRYLAHELVKDPRPPSTASDIHALGCIGLEVRPSLIEYNI
jgi:serine/threonine protein kinase